MKIAQQMFLTQTRHQLLHYYTLLFLRTGRVSWGLMAPQSRLLIVVVTPLPAWLSEDEAKTRNMIFEQGGYTGPRNRYVCVRHPNVDIRGIEPLIMCYRYKSAMRGINIPWVSSSLATDDQKSLDIPTVLVPGEYDYVCRLELQKPIAEKFLRNYRIEQFQCGHWIQHEKPDELVKLLEEFSGSL